jgi:hypothetical protein
MKSRKAIPRKNTKTCFIPELSSFINTEIIMAIVEIQITTESQVTEVLKTLKLRLSANALMNQSTSRSTQ